ncbi:MAG: prealbumin-like fold domain-containing protein [Thermomicrobiales bacterium]
MRPMANAATGWTRALLRAFVAVTLMLTITATSFVAAHHLTAPQAVLADDDDGGDDDDDDGGGNGTGGNGTGGNGTGGGPGDKKDKDKDDPADHDQGQGNDDQADQPGQGGPVVQVPEYRVVVECAPFDDSRSACMFIGLGDTGVKRVAVPHAEVCATVDGDSGDDGGAPAAEMLNATTGEPSYVSEDASLLLLLAGTVETNTTTTYWIWADDDQLYPATGPALVCDQPPAQETAAPPPTTGAILIRAFDCDPGIVAGADVDWYAACAQPATGATFSVSADAAGTAATAQDGATDDDGRLAVADLAPGTYQVEQTDGNWCHAESDNVDDQGDVLVEAGVESTIWVFNCQA